MRWRWAAGWVCTHAKEGKLKEKMQSKAKETFSADWKAHNGAACLSDDALFSFLAKAQTFSVNIAEKVQQEMWETSAGNAGEASLPGPAGSTVGDDML